MSLNIQLVTRPSTVLTLEGAVRYAFGQVTYGKVQPNDKFPIPFGTYNVNVTESLDPPFRQLYSHGCRQSDGSNNCTASCLSPNATFSDMYRLSNCVAYPKISEFLAGNNVRDDAEAIAKQFGIIGDLTTQRLVYDTTYNCLQSIISALGGFLLKTLTSWIYYILVAVLALPYGLPRAKKEAAAIRKAAVDGHLQVLLAALAEFQKAQCFFLIALEIAAQVVIRRGFLDSANQSELRNTYAMINAISTSGCLPVAFMLFCLHTAGMESWYLSVLTVCTVVIATATGYLTGNFQPSAGAIARLNRTTSNFESCGHRTSVAFCHTP